MGEVGLASRVDHRHPGPAQRLGAADGGIGLQDLEGVPRKKRAVPLPRLPTLRFNSGPTSSTRTLCLQ